MRHRASLTSSVLFLFVLQGCTDSQTVVRSTQPSSDAGVKPDVPDSPTAPADAATPADSAPDEEAPTVEPDASTPDAGQEPLGPEGPPRDPGCGDAALLEVLGDYWHGIREEHWLRKNERAVTYSIVPAERAEAGKPPRLYRVAQACNAGHFFMARDAQQGIVRVDWKSAPDDGTALLVCERSERFASIEDATDAPSPTSDAACSDATWRRLVRQSL